MCFRKMAGVLLSLALLLSLGGIASGAGSTGMIVTVSAPADAKPGDTITVELRSEGSPGISAAQFTLGFDATVLDCTDCEPGAALSGMMSAANPDAAAGAIIAAAGAKPVDGNGVLGVYTFKVLKAGDYGFVLSDTLFAREDGTTVSYTVKGAQDKPMDPGDSGKPDEGKPSDPGSAGQPDGGGESAAPVFTDCVDHWAQAYIEKAAALGLVNGVGDGKYAPDETMTRAHFVTILWRSAGEPEPAGPASFTDVTDASVYYYKAVAWAEENQVINGVGDGKFAPNGEVTREQLATILYRYHDGVSGGDKMWHSVYDSAFTDSGKVSDWARDAVYWAVYYEVWCGVGTAETGTALYPLEPADRAQIAVIMTRYLEANEEGGVFA